MPTATYVITLISVACGASFQFYTFGVVNPPQKIIQSWINQTYAERNDGIGLSANALTIFWSFTSSSCALGAALGCLLTRPLAEYLGRRNGILANGVVTVIGGILQFIAKPVKSPELLIVGRFLLGSCMGISSGLVPIYLQEISPVKYRGAAGTVHQIAVSFSDWFSLLMALPQVLGSEELWPWAFGFPALPALGMLIVLPFMPESPRYLLVMRRQRHKAFKAMEALVGKNDARLVFDGLVREAIISSTSVSLSYPILIIRQFQQLRKGEKSTEPISKLFTRKSLRTPLIIAVLVMLAQQFTGCAAVFAYSTDIFMKANLSAHVAQLSTLSIGIAYFLFVLPSPYLIEKQGRRFLSLFQLTGCLLALAVLSIFVFLQTNYGFAWASYGSIGALVIYMCIYGVGSPIPWLITGELFDQQHRSAAVTLTTFVAWFLAFVVTIAYLPLQKAVGQALSFVPFMVVLFAIIICLVFLLPETKNREIADIVKDFRKRSRTVSRTFTSMSQLRRPDGNPAELDWLLEVSAEHDSAIGGSESSKTTTKEPALTYGGATATNANGGPPKFKIGIDER